MGNRKKDLNLAAASSPSPVSKAFRLFSLFAPFCHPFRCRAFFFRSALTRVARWVRIGFSFLFRSCQDDEGRAVTRLRRGPIFQPLAGRTRLVDIFYFENRIENWVAISLKRYIRARVLDAYATITN